MTDVANVNDPSDRVEKDIAALQSGKSTVYSSITGDDFDAKIAQFHAISNSTPIADNLNTTFNLRHFIVQSVDMVDEATGVVKAQPRVILVSDEGDPYHAISSGLMTSLNNLVAIIGHPETWANPIPVQVVEERGRSGYRFMTIKVVSGSKK